MSRRIVGTLTDFQLAELGPQTVQGLSIDSLVAEARRRFPFCDVRVWRHEYRAAWEIEVGGYIEGEVVQKRDSLPCPQA